MKTFRLLITIIALGFFSLSCSNEELSIDEATVNNDALSSRKLPVFTPDELILGGDDVRLHQLATESRKGTLTVFARVTAINTNLIDTFKIGDAVRLNTTGSIVSFSPVMQ